MIADLGAGARFLTAVSEISEVGGHLGVRMGTAHVDLKLISEDAIYGDDEGSEHLGEWVILWFQETEPHPTPRQRFHLDVQVPYDVAEQRVAVAAGAVVVDDSQAPGLTVLADADGNKACVATFQPAPDR